MGYSTYSSLILIDPSSDISLGKVTDELNAFYSKDGEGRTFAVKVKGDTIVLSLDSYEFKISKSNAVHVLIESKEIAEEFAKNRPDKDRIALCSARFETVGDSDPDMDYFNDFLFIGEAIGRLGKVYWFDQNSSEFMDEQQ